MDVKLSNSLFSNLPCLQQVHNDGMPFTYKMQIYGIVSLLKIHMQPIQITKLLISVYQVELLPF